MKKIILKSFTVLSLGLGTVLNAQPLADEYLTRILNQPFEGSFSLSMNAFNGLSSAKKGFINPRIEDISPVTAICTIENSGSNLPSSEQVEREARVLTPVTYARYKRAIKLTRNNSHRSLSNLKLKTFIVNRIKESTDYPLQDHILNTYHFGDAAIITLRQMDSEKAQQILHKAGFHNAICEPNQIVSITSFNDPAWETYQRQNMALGGFDGTLIGHVTQGRFDVVIAVFDTGVDSNHPDLRRRIVGEINTIDNQRGDQHGHGTHVAGIIAMNTNNYRGGVGISSDKVKIFSVKVLNAMGYGSIESIIRGIHAMYREKRAGWFAFKVANFSLGAPGVSHSVEQALRRLSREGVIIVMAAGNNRANNDIYPFWPAGFRTLPFKITVGSIEACTQSPNTCYAKSSFSNYGVNTVEIGAPGRHIFSTVPSGLEFYGGMYTTMSGTSMAAPFVSGLLGLALSHEIGLRLNRLIEIVTSTACNRRQELVQYFRNGCVVNAARVMQIVRRR